MFNFTIIRKEFLDVFLSKPFLIATFAAPLIPVAMFFYISAIAYVGAAGIGQYESESYAFVDFSNLTEKTLGRLNEGQSYTFGRIDMFSDKNKRQAIAEAMLQEFPSDESGANGNDAGSVDKDSYGGDSARKSDKNNEKTGNKDRHKSPKLKLFIYKSIEAARQAVTEKDLEGVVLLKEDFFDTGIVYVLSDDRRHDFSHRNEIKLRSLVKTQLYNLIGQPPNITELLIYGAEIRPMTYSEYEGDQLDEEEPENITTQFLVHLISYYFVSAVFLYVIVSNSGLFAVSMSAEQESKLIDVLLTTVSPQELLLGKTLGIVGASLFRLFLWLGMAIVSANLIDLSPDLSFEIQMTTGNMVFSLIIAVLGMVFYGLLITSLCSGSADTSSANDLGKILKWAFQFSLILFFALGYPALSELHLKLLAFIPFLTPFILPIELANPDYPLGDAIMFTGVMVVAVLLAVRLSGQVMKMNLESRGQTVSRFNPLRLLY